MPRYSYDTSRWDPDTADVNGSLDSELPTWVLTARRGRQIISLASGPLHTQQLARSIARTLNDTDPELWDRFIRHELPHILAGTWG